MPLSDDDLPFVKLPPTPIPGASAPDVELSGPDRPNLQQVLQMVSEEFLQHDTIALSRLTSEQRQQQLEARERLWGLALSYWEQAKVDGAESGGPYRVVRHT